ncbi:MAG: uncharacterized protein A8A55_1377 [Amphiamblys sp. WSBS2006]|nr:MAG: uncharacterized protein A8A55_1377 [Amphiamblys sp. WSBS2006]
MKKNSDVGYFFCLATYIVFFLCVLAREKCRKTRIKEETVEGLIKKLDSLPQERAEGRTNIVLTAIRGRAGLTEKESLFAESVRRIASRKKQNTTLYTRTLYHAPEEYLRNTDTPTPDDVLPSDVLPKMDFLLPSVEAPTHIVLLFPQKDIPVEKTAQNAFLVPSLGCVVLFHSERSGGFAAWLEKEFENVEAQTERMPLVVDVRQKLQTLLFYSRAGFLSLSPELVSSFYFSLDALSKDLLGGTASHDALLDVKHKTERLFAKNTGTVLRSTLHHRIIIEGPLLAPVLLIPGAFFLKQLRSLRHLGSLRKLLL